MRTTKLTEVTTPNQGNADLRGLIGMKAVSPGLGFFLLLESDTELSEGLIL